MIRHSNAVVTTTARPSSEGSRPGPILAAGLVLIAGLFLPETVLAQGEASAGAREMRHFWHVFIAYAVAWILLFGWVVSILRRVSRVEDILRG